MSLRSRRTLILVSISVIIALGVVLLSLFEFPLSVTTSANIPGGSLSLGASLGVNPQTGAGILNITVINNSDYPFTSIVITQVSPSLPGIVGATPFTYNGALVSSSNPLPNSAGSAAGSQAFASGGNLAATYNVTLSITLPNGQVFQQVIQRLYPTPSS